MIDFDARQHLEGQGLLAAEQEGRLVVLPCRIGDTVYVIGRRYRAGRYETWINTGKFRPSDIDKLGETVFLTRAEAESALVDCGAFMRYFAKSWF